MAVMSMTMHSLCDLASPLFHNGNCASMNLSVKIDEIPPGGLHKLNSFLQRWNIERTPWHWGVNRLSYKNKKVTERKSVSGFGTSRRLNVTVHANDRWIMLTVFFADYPIPVAVKKVDRFHSYWFLRVRHVDFRLSLMKYIAVGGDHEEK